MARRRDSDYQARLDHVGERFGHFLLAHDVDVDGDSKALRTHIHTLNLLREAGSVTEAVRNPGFVPSVTATLKAWGMGKRRSVLANAEDFQASLDRLLDQVSALEGLHIETADPDAVAPRLWSVIDQLGVVENESRIVGGTKALHHLLPDLVPPMDRAYTGAFFGLRDHHWQAGYQKDTFIEVYGAMAQHQVDSVLAGQRG